MKIDLALKRILVTGGTRGIGEQIAQLFESSGAVVTVTGRSEDSWNGFRERNTNSKTSFKKVDFAKLEELVSFVDWVKTNDFDVLVNNAGINKINSFLDTDLASWQEIQDVNVRAPLLISQAVTQSMKRNGWGRIIHIASVFGTVSKEKRVAYTTSKSAIIGMTKTMAIELAASRILVNCVSPGFIDTELTRQILGEKGIQEMVKQVPMGVLGNARDIANLVLFLASPMNGFITGQNVVIDGGFTCA